MRLYTTWSIESTVGVILDYSLRTRKYILTSDRGERGVIWSDAVSFVSTCSCKQYTVLFNSSFTKWAEINKRNQHKPPVSGRADTKWCFILTNNYKNKAIQRRGVEANGAMALQPVEGRDLVCQQTAKSMKEKQFYNKSSRCCLRVSMKPSSTPIAQI